MTRFKTVKENTQFNVLLLGMDTMSRMNFHRTMKETLKYLQDLDAIEFEGYNKVADNTLPNLVPVLSGLTLDELNAKYISKTVPYYDDGPFIWKDYSRAGYYTAYAEDAPAMFSFQQDYDEMFQHKPTDAYWRPFSYLVDQEQGNFKDVFNNLCFGSRLAVDVLLSYIKKFVKTMSTSLYFGLFWEVTLSHDFINRPTLCDKKYVTLLKWMVAKGFLNNTVLVMFSDHGARWGNISITKQGYAEERLPALFFVFPKTFKETYPLAIANIKMNANKLTTPFDLHATITNLLKTSDLSDKKIYEKMTSKDYIHSRGISLFLPIDYHRTCKSSGIDLHWCTCHQKRTKNNLNNTESIHIPDVVINHVNNLMKENKKCAKLHLSKIIDLTSVETEDKKIVNTIIVQTIPGDGILSATVWRKEGRDVQTQWTISGTVSRLNLYGNDSYCTNNKLLKLYCYCLT